MADESKSPFETLHETYLNKGRTAIKSGQYGRFLEVSKNKAKAGEPARWSNVEFKETELASVYAIRDECERFIALCKSD